jgi:3-oxoacyl-(acyl-carrier-protein) synthase
MRVVITGVGVVTSIGIRKEEFWAAITEKLTTPNEKIVRLPSGGHLVEVLLHVVGRCYAGRPLRSLDLTLDLDSA